MSVILSKGIYERVNDSFYREEFILYAPSERLDKVKQQVTKEFGNQISSFEWWHEEEYTTIMVEIRSTVMQIPVGDRLRQIVKAVVGEQYIVSASVRPIETVGCTNSLFNLTYDGALETFFIDYYAPEHLRANAFSVSIYDGKMIEVISTIHLDSAEQLWERLIRPLDEKYAKHEGVNSFTKELLAQELRDFLLKHLDFIKHIGQAVNKPLQILAPVPQPSLLSSNGTGREPQKWPIRAVRKPKREVAVALPALATA
jgi:hypothetical protein